ncbi:uncharacterized protein LOC126901694 isoform X2 [Daktulosphaira vitifoliae]|uniref:uncharacterized protein LOC126901694 isoform X2 n=1 Tax=Daktulosphaira vitifoliae TaxID=58002 RepID=UPI0021AA2A6D|nr:uncharacterized protein LOC126901694 isoform X2 [Daktulosphaira vitifoliae]
MTHHGIPIAEYVYIEHIKESSKGSVDVYKEFLDKTDTAAKYHYVYSLLEKYNWLPSWDGDRIKLSRAHRRWRKRLRKELKTLGANVDMNCSSMEKNNIMADKLRSRGNDEFKSNKNEESLSLYTKALMVAPVDSVHYALAVANRSAVLYHMCEYSCCIKDVDRALLSGMYPQELTYKLLERKGNCFWKLGKKTQAIQTYSLSLTAISNTQLLYSDKQNIKKRIFDNIKKCQELSTKNNFKKSKKRVLRFLQHANNNVPLLSESVRATQLEKMGRGLTAIRNIIPGEVLVIEKPFAGICKNNEWKYNCNYCFKRCLAAIPCSNCTQVLYCDQTCLEKAYNSYHKIECSFVYPLKGDPTVESTHALAMRCFIQMTNTFGIESYCSQVEEFEKNRSNGINFHEIMMTDQFYSIYGLQGNENTRSVENLFFIYCKSLVHLLCITNLNSYVSMELPAGYSSRKTINIPNACTNLTTITLILSPLYSLINHSCDPNVIVHTYDGIEVTRALQPIPKGSQLFTCYGNNFMSRSTQERKAYLLDQFDFHCKCQACEDDWPVYLWTDSFFLSERQPLDFKLHCLHPDTMEKFYEIYEKLLPSQSVNSDHLSFLFSFLYQLQNCVKKPNALYYKCIEVIKQCLYFTINEFTVDDQNIIV